MKTHAPTLQALRAQSEVSSNIDAMRETIRTSQESSINAGRPPAAAVAAIICWHDQLLTLDAAERRMLAAIAAVSEACQRIRDDLNEADRI